MRQADYMVVLPTQRQKTRLFILASDLANPEASYYLVIMGVYIVRSLYRMASKPSIQANSRLHSQARSQKFPIESPESLSEIIALW